MVRAYVLIQTEVGQTGRVAQEVAEIEGTGSTVPVAGPYDVIAIVESASIDALGKLVVSRIQGVKGVTRTLTCTVVQIRGKRTRLETDRPVRVRAREGAERALVWPIDLDLEPSLGLMAGSST
jgi:DNA-binding Lrp family transcriptional regulator